MILHQTKKKTHIWSDNPNIIIILIEFNMKNEDQCRNLRFVKSFRLPIQMICYQMMHQGLF